MTMKTLLSILITIHGLIHLMGFFKAFELGSFPALTLPISRISGIWWLLAGLLFIAAVILRWVAPDYWWLPGMGAVLVSQVLIIQYWQDAKFGTVANAILLIASITGYAHHQLALKIQKERSQLLAVQERLSAPQIPDELPDPVKKWLKYTGIEDRQPVQTVYLTQQVRMKSKPGQSGWYQGNADQYFTLDPPAFHWAVEIALNPIISLSGRDQFSKGQGDMLIKAGSVIPIVSVSNIPKLNQASMQRYLAEIVWFPWAVRSPCISWTSVDDHTAQATMSYQGMTGSGTFTFSDQGEFKRFTAMRYKDVDDNAEPLEWIIDVLESKTMNGIRVPVKMSVSWRIDHELWTWLELEITGIHYDIGNQIL